MWVGDGNPQDCRRRHNVGLLMRSNRHTSAIRRNCNGCARGLSSDGFEGRVFEVGEGAVMGPSGARVAQLLF